MVKFEESVAVFNSTDRRVVWSTDDGRKGSFLVDPGDQFDQMDQDAKEAYAAEKGVEIPVSKQTTFAYGVDDE